MGRDKAAIEVQAIGVPALGVPAGPAAGPVTLAERTARLLGAVADPVIEVGPGRSHLTAVSEDPPGAGPLAAVAAGASALAGAGWSGPVLVVATDLPRLDEGLLRWLVSHPDPRSVVPVAAGRVQPLCARYCADDLHVAGRLVAAGRRAMGDLLAAIDAHRAPEEEWSAASSDLSALCDADTPGDLERLVTGWPATGGEVR